MSLPWLTGEAENSSGIPGRSNQGNNSGELRNSHAGETHFVPWSEDDFRKKPVPVVHMEEDSAPGHTTPDGKSVVDVKETEAENLA